MKIKNKFAVIFDCDGTLIKSLDVGMGSYNYAFERLGERFREPDEIKKYFGAGADRIFFQLLGDEKKALEAFDYYFEHETKNVSKLFLHDGIQELIDKLHGGRVPLGVVTGRHHRDLELIFNHLELGEYFQALICDNHLPNSKPAPDGIIMACEKMGFKPSDIYYIGDSTMDIKAANAAGAKGIAALWDSWAKPEEMLREGPVFMAKTPAEVWNYISEKEL